MPRHTCPATLWTLQMGGRQLYKDLADVKLEIDKVAAADTVDNTKLKVKKRLGVKPPGPLEYQQRKLVVIMTAITQPGRLETATASLWSAYLAVLATLKLEFARTTAIALGIGQTIEAPASRLLSPALDHLLGQDLSHWTSTIIRTIINVICITIAWFAQQVISMYYAALRGGRMFGVGVLLLVHDNGWDTKLPERMRSWFDPDQSYLDEILGFGLAAGGMVFQSLSLFTIFFPLNIVLFPLTIIEWFLRFQITFSSDTGVPAGGSFG